MVREDTVRISVRELNRVHVIRQVIDHGLRHRSRSAPRIAGTSQRWRRMCYSWICSTLANLDRP